MDLIVGTFNTSDLFTLHFTPLTPSSQATLTIVRAHSAKGKHSWLALAPIITPKPSKRFLYATAWTEKPSVAAYSISRSRDIQFINARNVRSQPGYVCASKTHLYSVGGPSGEVFTIQPDGSIGELIQELSFVEQDDVSTEHAAVPHGDFGGLRHGAHSVDLSPSGRSLYVADIGRNAIFTFTVNSASTGPHLVLGSKHVASRANDGPRHTWPHPNGKSLYVLQEHSSMVDVFNASDDGITLRHAQGVKIIPAEKDCADYWADEVRLSTLPPNSQNAYPRYMYASTRGLHKETKGYVAVFELNADGTLASETAVCIWETPTSGGIANAIEPAPWKKDFEGVEYLAMTDSEEGWVLMLGFDGSKITEVARASLGRTAEGKVVQAATAIWIPP